MRRSAQFGLWLGVGDRWGWGGADLSVLCPGLAFRASSVLLGWGIPRVTGTQPAGAPGFEVLCGGEIAWSGAFLLGHWP